MTDNEKMLVDAMFDSWYYRKGDYVSYEFRSYYYKPSDLYKLSDLEREDKKACEDIKKLESKIEQLKAYRKACFERYQEVNSDTTKKLLRLERYKGYSSDNKVFYFIRLYEIFSDGTKVEIQCDKYAGKDRKAAFEAFEAYKKSHPGIEAEKDIGKKSWEH